MAVNQIAVSAHGVVAPSALILIKPPVTPLTHSEIILTVHGFYLLFANATIPQKERNSYCFRICFSISQFGAVVCNPDSGKPSGLLCISPDSLLLFRAVSSCLKRRLAVPLHGNFTPPRFSPSCPIALSLWLGRKYHCPQIGIFAKLVSAADRFPDRWNRSCLFAFSAGCLRASSAVACPQAGSPIRECISATGNSVFKVPV